MMEGTLYYQYGPEYTALLVIPESAVSALLVRLHESLGHAGQNKLLAAVRQRYWWPHQRRDIRELCNNCGVCAQVKNPQRRNCAPLQSIVTGYPNELLELDFVGPLPETARGNRYILVMVDHFTKWCEVAPLAQTDATTTCKAMFEHWIFREDLIEDSLTFLARRAVNELIIE